jgi:hypothetical protein
MVFPGKQPADIQEVLGASPIFYLCTKVVVELFELLEFVELLEFIGFHDGISVRF